MRLLSSTIGLLGLLAAVGPAVANPLRNVPSYSSRDHDIQQADWLPDNAAPENNHGNAAHNAECHNGWPVGGLGPGEAWLHEPTRFTHVPQINHRQDNCLHPCALISFAHSIGRNLSTTVSTRTNWAHGLDRKQPKYHPAAKYQWSIPEWLTSTPCLPANHVVKMFEGLGATRKDLIHDNRALTGENARHLWDKFFAFPNLRHHETEANTLHWGCDESVGYPKCFEWRSASKWTPDSPPVKNLSEPMSLHDMMLWNKFEAPTEGKNPSTP